MRILLRLVKSLNPYRWQLGALILLVLAVIATSLVTPSLIQSAIDNGLEKHSPDALFHVALVIVGVGLLRALFGCDSFAIDPYQLGHHNAEGLSSGAWWFYYKLGFRPIDPAARPWATRATPSARH